MRQIRGFRAESVEVFRGSTIPPGLPEVVAPAGLSEQTKNYFFKETRKYCRKGTEDLVTPNPDKY